MKRIRKTIISFITAAAAVFAMGIPVQAEESTLNVYRLFNPYNDEHLYTADENEYNSLGDLGWIQEGIGWIAAEEGDTPVYRLYNPFTGQHHYTMDEEEYSSLPDNGWVPEGPQFSSLEDAGSPVYRLYNPFNGEHLFTTDLDEYENLGWNTGWQQENIAWYGRLSETNPERQNALQFFAWLQDQEDVSDEAKEDARVAGELLSGIIPMNVFNQGSVDTDKYEAMIESTKVGRTNDATDLHNFKHAVDFIALGNQYRAEEGHAPLRVSSLLMAEEILTVNYIGNGAVFDHPKVFNMGENLAEGFSFNRNYRNGTEKYIDAADPFTAWVDREREFNGGHYRNVMNDSYELTGFAVSGDNIDTNSSFGSQFKAAPLAYIYGQSFELADSDGDSFPGNGMPVEEYQELLNRFMGTDVTYHTQKGSSL